MHSVARCVNVVVCSSLALVVAAAPLQAQAGLLPQSTGSRLRTIMSFDQDPAEAPADAPADAPIADAPAPAGPVAEGPTPAPAPAPAPMGPAPRKGLGLMITGAVLTGAVGLPLTIYGVLAATVLNRAGEEAGVQGAGVLAVPVIVVGVLFLSAGAPMLGVGAYRFSQYQKWKRGQVSWTPSVNRTAFGTYTAGVALRF